MEYCAKILWIFCVLMLSSPIFIKGQTDESWMTDEMQRAIDRGLRYLAAHQNLQGSPQANDNHGSFYENANDQKYTIAITSFASLSFLANGNLPNRGKYGNNVSHGVNFILRHVNPGSGYISKNNDDSRMHGHGFAVLLLAEVYGMSSGHGDKVIYDKLKNSIQCILRAQTKDGGWGYMPEDDFHEGSITVCELQALRAARNVGIKVPKANIDLAIRYLQRSANPDGSFKYRLGMTGRAPSFPLTAAGVSSLNATGEYESKEVQKGLEFMIQYLPPGGKSDQFYNAFYYYGHFYASQAMYHAPSQYWKEWYPAVCRDLLSKQYVDGSWGKNMSHGYSRFGPVYATAIATLILQIPYNYLTIFQK